MITAAQCRAARALVDLTQQALADASGVGLATLKTFEGGGAATAATVETLKTALATAGAVFIPEDSVGGAGVRLKFTRSVVRQIDRLENEGGAVGGDDI
ncbi:XRE family transcriptional regulator [Aestuariivirga sp.]|uniref:XRE family transcriptional regulator n=1 Tax=Aestuariivirga sp. TaxID=2650926 RepID=UPI0039E573C1